MSLRFTERALGDLARLKEFIAERDPASAERVVAALVESLRSLAAQPLAGRSLDDLPVRQWIAGNYVVRHVVRRNDEVVIVRIWHGREARQEPGR